MDIFTRLNWVDLLVVIIMLRTTYNAFRDGLSHEIFPLIAYICGVIISLRYYGDLAIFVSKNLFNLQIETARFISFVMLLVGIGFILKLISALVDKLIKVTWHPVVEKFGGLVFGLVRASIKTSLVLIIIALLPLSYLTWSIKDRSLLGMHFLRIAPAIYEKVAWVVPSMRTAELENIVKNVVADKPEPQGSKKTKKQKAEWEKVF